MTVSESSARNTGLNAWPMAVHLPDQDRRQCSDGVVGEMSTADRCRVSGRDGELVVSRESARWWDVAPADWSAGVVADADGDDIANGQGTMAAPIPAAGVVGVVVSGVIVERGEDPLEYHGVLAAGVGIVEQEPVGEQEGLAGPVAVDHRVRVGGQVHGDHHRRDGSRAEPTDEPVASTSMAGTVKHRWTPQEVGTPGQGHHGTCDAPDREHMSLVIGQAAARRCSRGAGTYRPR